MSVLSFLIFVTLVVRQVSASCAEKKDCLSCTSTFTSFGRCHWQKGTSRCGDGGQITANMVQDPLSCPIVDSTDEGEEEFDPARAYIATLLAAVAYTDQPYKCLDKVFSGEIQLVEVVGKKCENLILFPYNECVAYVALWHSQRRIILSYRGTTSTWQLIDQFISTVWKKTSKVGGYIHRYFENANAQLYPCVAGCIIDLVRKYPDYSIMIIGHSLGGAIASVSSAYLSGDKITKGAGTTLYTFGMPRPGNREFAKKHHELVPHSWRVVNKNDIITSLPLKLIYPIESSHHPREIYYEHGMNTSSQFIKCNDLDSEDPKCSAKNFPLKSGLINDHLSYYNLHVGEYCDTIMKRRRKRSDEPSEMSHLLSNSTCKRLKFCGDQVCGVCGIHVHGAFTLLFVSLICWIV